MAVIVLPKVKPDVPVLVRMNGKCEDFDIFQTSLRKKNGFSDVVVVRFRDGSLSIESRACNGGTDSRRKRMNTCTLTIEQAEVVRYIQNCKFEKAKEG